MRISMKDPRYKMPAETRKFGGKVYKYFMSGYGSKREAEAAAERWRLRGFLVRVVLWQHKYALYTRSSPK